MRISSPQWGPTGATKKTLNGSYYAQRSGVGCEYHPLNGDPREQQKITEVGPFYAQRSGWLRISSPQWGPMGATKKTLIGVFLCTAEGWDANIIPSMGTHGSNKKDPEWGLFMHSGEGGIRTHGSPKTTTVFETAPIGHSGTSPNRQGLL